jgi:hypothetical protein
MTGMMRYIFVYNYFTYCWSLGIKITVSNTGLGMTITSQNMIQEEIKGETEFG